MSKVQGKDELSKIKIYSNADDMNAANIPDYELKQLARMVIEMMYAAGRDPKIKET